MLRALARITFTTYMKLCLRPALPGEDRGGRCYVIALRIGVMLARSPAVNGIRPDDFLPCTLAPTALLADVSPVLRPLGGVKAGASFPI